MLIMITDVGDKKSTGSSLTAKISIMISKMCLLKQNTAGMTNSGQTANPMYDPGESVGAIGITTTVV